MKFTGQLKFPDIDHPGIPVVFVIDDIHIEMDVDAEAVGRWSLVDVQATRLVASAFLLNLDGEEVTFIADEPLDFAYQGVEHMAETWARVKSLSLPRRSVAVRKSRRGTIPSRIYELRDAVLETMEQPAMPIQTPSSPPAELVVSQPAEPAVSQVVEQIGYQFEWATTAEELEEREEQRSPLLPGPGLVGSLARADLDGVPMPVEDQPTEEEMLARADEEVESHIEAPQLEAEPEPAVGVPAAALEEAKPLQAWFEDDDSSEEPVMDPLEWPERASETPAALQEEPVVEEPVVEEPVVEEPVVEEPDVEEPVVEEPEVEEPVATPVEEAPAAEVEELELPEETKQLLGTPAGSDEGLFVDLGRYEDTPPDEEPPAADDEPEPDDASPASPEPALVGTQPEKGGLLGAVRSAFGRSSRVPHEHEFVDAPGGMGLTRQICAECGHISIRSDD